MKYVNLLNSRIARASVAASLFAGTLAACGCAGPSLFSRQVSADEPGPSIDNVMGPTERGLRQVAFERGEKLRGGSDKDLELAREKYNRAKQLFDNKDYAGAERAFKSIVDERRKSYETFQTRFESFWGLGKDSLAYDQFGDPVEEDALFMLAESQFARQRFTKAQDSYDDLLNRYPSTRHMDRVTRQMFRMARYWLNFPTDTDETTSSEIQLASADVRTPGDVAVSSGQPAKSGSIFPNLTDKTRPVYDADGRGLQALRSIWLHDATGPLADDALMLSANHNLRIRNHIEAKRLYTLLREQYPDSPHLKDAYLLGAHVTMAAYEGPEYDGEALHEARDLKQSLLQLYPDLSSEERQRLESEINQMHTAEIERIWEQVRFYQVKGTTPSVALYCNVLINRYPNSEYADRAREVLRNLESSNNGGRFWPWSGGATPTQTAETPVQSNPTDPRTSTRPQPVESRPAEDQSGTEKRSLFNFLRKADEAPQLQSTPDRPASGAATL
ncbi:Outer membrane protein assembly factor BamD [Thalassoglobus neptunius]|uniref:Outer membrane protein assembly factor BamD n=1 Tax=Thalassoglobus neptunius TaxID=1938619 RepID=A0A5C5VXC3_9PLAN|nr:tetratricopeptide repeat protein [Thalassoglobus neptunius]TWT42603.1 Outer membrane protein assembly factor BamD [Thalassoglobus neptunius]